MTRKEEREQAAHNYAFYFPEDYVNENDYIAGAEWADNTILDRIEAYINAHEYLVHYKSIDYIFNELRKAIEENEL